jgi:transposase-like protein
MPKVTISILELFKKIPDEETARGYLEARLWSDGVKCPECDSGERIKKRKGGYYRCNACLLDFTVRTGTIFERSHVPLHKWIYAMYMLVTARKGISSLQLSKEIGITQKSAWFVLHRLREACGNKRTNGIESVSAVMKRGMFGVYHHSSDKHLGRYVDEFAFRLNEGNVKRHTLQQLDSFIVAVAGRRITYKELTGDTESNR